MARPKSTPKPNKDDWKINKKIVFQMRGSEEFKAWLIELAEFDAADTTEVVERALATYARTIEFKKPRPKR